MEQIIYIADPAVLAIPVVECHEPLIDIKERTELAYGPPPECLLTEPDYTKMRQSVFEKLCLAQQQLPKSWRFRVYEGFRSLAVQQMLFDQQYHHVLARYPQATHEECFRETTRLVSPVTNSDGSKNIPPHNTGAAIDIEILSHEGTLIDMGMTAKDWQQVDPALCMTDCPFISDEAKQNRKLLLRVMGSQGFVNYPTEWWHFSFGDRYWAYHQKAKNAFYGSIE